jgi:hypothetical protein
MLNYVLVSCLSLFLGPCAARLVAELGSQVQRFACEGNLLINPRGRRSDKR